ncbi:MAG: CoA-binding protein [Anaerolineae bacterium]
MPVEDPLTLRDILAQARVIAVVGHSDKPHRTSYQIGRQLERWGYVVYPVNPTVSRIDGERCYPSLAAVPEAVDIVNVFRRPEHLAGIVEEAIQIGAKTIWTQLGVIDEAAARRAEEAGLTVVMDRCIKIEYQRLLLR